ncbi:MAG: hypothetical protein OXC68_01165 [Aestuariivita sp.]|nr:hypothetical protein [Aestuariivita sp.]
MCAGCLISLSKPFTDAYSGLLCPIPVDVEIGGIKEVLVAFGDEPRQLASNPGIEALSVSGVDHRVEEDLAAGVFLALSLCNTGPEGVHPGLECLLFLGECRQLLRIGRTFPDRCLRNSTRAMRTIIRLDTVVPIRPITHEGG